MKDYIIMFEASDAELAAKVNEQLAKGFIPVGGVSVTYVPDEPVQSYKPGMYFMQAMAKRIPMPVKGKSKFFK